MREYLFALLFLLIVAAWILVKRLPSLLRTVRSANWPTAEGRVETVGVNTFAEQSLGEVGYWYSVEGIRYSGYFSQQFADEQDAWTYVNPLSRQPVVVRYKLGDPSTSTLRLREQNVLFTQRPGSFLKRLLKLPIQHARN